MTLRLRKRSTIAQCAELDPGSSLLLGSCSWLAHQWRDVTGIAMEVGERPAFQHVLAELETISEGHSDLHVERTESSGVD